MQKIKVLLSGFVALCFGLAVQAATVAQIGTTAYETLADAIAVGGEITLVADVTENIVIPAGRTVTLKGAYSISPANKNSYTVDVQGTLVLDGVTVEGVAGLTANGPSAVRVGWDDAATAAGGTATLTVKSGTIRNGLNVIKADSGAVVDIQGGTFSKDNSIKGTALVLNYGQVTISGGTFTAAKTSDTVLTNAGTSPAGMAMVTGGTFVGSSFTVAALGASCLPEGYSAVYYAGGTTKVVKDIPVGAFKTLAGTVNGQDVYYYCADEAALIAKTCVASVDGVYMTKAQAFKAGKTVKMFRDYTYQSSTLSLAGFTLDLNGTTMTVQKDDNSLIFGASATIRNGTLNASAVKIMKEGVAVTVKDVTMPEITTTKDGYMVAALRNTDGSTTYSIVPKAYTATVGSQDISLTTVPATFFPTTAKTFAQRQEYLETAQANGLLAWQNYVMGIDGTVAANKITTVSTGVTGETVTLTVPLTFNPPADTGVTVTYVLKKSTDRAKTWKDVRAQATPTFAVDLTGEPDGDTLWKIVVVFSATQI